MIKFWEIVKGMCDQEYNEGQVFVNADCGNMVIENGILKWEEYYDHADGNRNVTVVLGDDMDWELK